MDKRILVLLIMIYAIALPNEIKKTNSVITEATVYLSGAQIKRIAEINVQPGINEILLSNLSPNIDENSIQVSGLKNTSIASISFAIDFLEKKKESDQISSLRKELEKLLKEKNSMENILSGLSQEKKVFDNNQQINAENTELSLEKLKQIATFYRERSVEIQNETYETNQKMKVIDQEIKNLTNEINKLSDNVQKERGEIKLKLNSPIATNLMLEIRYNVSTAGWFPLYDIKSISTENPVHIDYKANIYQQTGSDWNDIKIILSTGDPTTNNLKPELKAKYLNFIYGSYRKPSAIRNTSHKYNPSIRRVTGYVRDHNGSPIPGVNVTEKGTSNGATTDFNGKYAIDITTGRELEFSYVGFIGQIQSIYSSIMNIGLKEDASALDEVVVVGYGNKSSIRRLAELSEAKGALKEERKPETVEAYEQGITNARFVIRKKYSIPSNTEVTTIIINKFENEAAYQYYAAPELNENVFLTANLIHWEQYNLLAGEANIYFEGSFAGKTTIDPSISTDSLTISLGTDPNIIVKKEPLQNLKSTSLIGGTKIVDLGYTIEVKNNKQHTINLILEDRIPISQNKEIKIDEIETDDAVYDDKTGIMKWAITLGANQKLKKQFSYRVRYPGDQRVNL